MTLVDTSIVSTHDRTAWPDHTNRRRRPTAEAYEARLAVEGLVDVVSTEGVTEGLDMESDRLLFEDVRARNRQPAAVKIQGHRRVETPTVPGPDARLHMRQEDHLYQPALSETHCRLASATARPSHCEESLRGD